MLKTVVSAVLVAEFILWLLARRKIYCRVSMLKTVVSAVLVAEFILWLLAKRKI